MAFWGVEVKSNKSLTLKLEGQRLHLSQATLGNRKSDEKTVVKCTVRNLPAVYLCSLLPGTVETCSLNLYFDEDVTFSVKGPTSVHLVGYFDGNKSDENDEDDDCSDDEDVEDDDYSDEEEEEEDSEGDSLDDFIVSEDEDDKEWSSGEYVPTNVRKSGVTTRELSDAPSLNDSKIKAESKEEGIIPHKSVSKKSNDGEAKGSTRALVEHHGGLKQESAVATDDKHTNSSEDNDNIQPSKKMLSNAPVITPAVDREKDIYAPLTASSVDQDMDTDFKESSKKKKRKNSKSSPEAASTSMQGIGLLKTPSKHSKSVKKGKKERPTSQISAAGTEHDADKKVRNYPTGLEIKDALISKADGKQATPGKKVLVK